jgi:hypothetical protein
MFLTIEAIDCKAPLGRHLHRKTQTQQPTSSVGAKYNNAKHINAFFH